MREITGTSNQQKCCLCGKTENNELIYGKFYEHSGFVTHYFCLLLSSSLLQRGNDEDGILGFLPKDIDLEIRRGKRLVCCYCKKNGATIGCSVKKCKRIFHYPCGLKSGCLNQFFNEFRSFCPKHRPKQQVDEQVITETLKCDSVICYICYDTIESNDYVNTLWAPCCKKNAWFHRKCVQQLAFNAGYFFKCPLCNNKDEFQNSMLENGIFIPSQDASWELEPNAFQELLYRHDQCDAITCNCPKGRKHTSSSNANWELILCHTCGSQGIHVACGHLKWANPKWECSECTSILNKSKINNSNVLSLNSMSNNGSNHDELDSDTDSDISVGMDSPIPYQIMCTIPVKQKILPGPRSFKLKQLGFGNILDSTSTKVKSVPANKEKKISTIKPNELPSQQLKNVSVQLLKINGESSSTKWSQQQNNSIFTDHNSCDTTINHDANKQINELNNDFPHTTSYKNATFMNNKTILTNELDLNDKIINHAALKRKSESLFNIEDSQFESMESVSMCKQSSKKFRCSESKFIPLQNNVIENGNVSNSNVIILAESETKTEDLKEQDEKNTILEKHAGSLKISSTDILTEGELLLDENYDVSFIKNEILETIIPFNGNKSSAVSEFGRSSTKQQENYTRTDFMNIESSYEDFSEVTNNPNACDQPEMIPEFVSLHNLKFRISDTNTLRMILYDTFSVDINVDIANRVNNYSQLEGLKPTVLLTTKNKISKQENFVNNSNIGSSSMHAKKNMEKYSETSEYCIEQECDIINEIESTYSNKDNTRQFIDAKENYNPANTTFGLLINTPNNFPLMNTYNSRQENSNVSSKNQLFRNKQENVLENTDAQKSTSDNRLYNYKDKNLFDTGSDLNVTSTTMGIRD